MPHTTDSRPKHPGDQPHVLLLSLVFSPDGVSTANLLADLVRGLTAEGIRVSVVTTTPHFNRDPDCLQAQPLTSRCFGMCATSVLEGVPVYHVRVPRKRRGVLNRLVAYFLFHSIGSVLAVLAVRRPSVVLTPSPPLTSGLNAWLLGRVRRIPFVYNVQEIYPDVAVELGVLRNPKIIGVFERLERFIYSRADTTTVISERFRRKLVEKGADPSLLRVIPNFVDTEFITPRPKINPFSKRYGLADRFVVLYSGNIGLTQDWESLLEVANRLRDDQRVMFAVVGDGAASQMLDYHVQTMRLDNFALIPYQPKSAVPDIYAASDVCVIPMKSGTTRDTFPSKVYAIMAAGRAVVASADKDSELADLITASSCGWCVPPEDVDAFEAAVRATVSQPDILSRAGNSGRRYVEAHHSPRAASQRYCQLIRELTNGKDRSHE